jgi:hypothetical protein
MNKVLSLSGMLVGAMLSSAVLADSPVGGTSMQLDTTSCYTWGGSGPSNSWTRCDSVKPVVQQKVVEKVVAAPAPLKIEPVPAPDKKKKIRE